MPSRVVGVDDNKPLRVQRGSVKGGSLLARQRVLYLSFPQTPSRRFPFVPALPRICLKRMLLLLLARGVGIPKQGMVVMIRDGALLPLPVNLAVLNPVLNRTCRRAFFT